MKVRPEDTKRNLVAHNMTEKELHALNEKKLRGLEDGLASSRLVDC